MKEARADPCAENVKLSGLAGPTSSMGEKSQVFQVTYFLSYNAYMAQHT